MKVYDLTEQPAVRQGKQHLFVLCYDAEQRQWYHDVDVEEARFMDGTIYDEASGTWLNGYLGDGEYEEGVEDCAVALHEALVFLNERVYG
jgi:hypothetical protein